MVYNISTVQYSTNNIQPTLSLIHLQEIQKKETLQCTHQVAETFEVVGVDGKSILVAGLRLVELVFLLMQQSLLLNHIKAQHLLSLILL